MKIRALSLLVAVLLIAQPGSAADPAMLQADIEQVRDQIADAQETVATYSGGMLQFLAQVRLETLRLTESLLEQRLLAEENDIPLDASLPVREPDTEELARIAEEIDKASNELAAAEAEVSSAGGLIGALGAMRIATIKQQIAILQLGAYQAAYGISLPDIDPSAAGTPEEQEAEPNTSPSAEDAVVSEESLPDWADPAHPEIDYSDPIFSALSDTDEFKGWWAINEERAAIDDSPSVTAFHLQSSVESTSYFGDTPTVIVRCSEGETAFIFSVDEFLLTDYGQSGIDVTYRIDSEPAQTERWSETTSHNATGLFGSRAVTFIQKLIPASRLFLRVVERNGKTHDLVIDLTGIGPVVEQVSHACGWLPMTQEEVAALQSALQSAGYYSGTVDGVWGSGSRTALDAWRGDHGMDTGVPLTRGEVETILMGADVSTQ